VVKLTKVSRKGRVSIPHEILQRFGFKPGTVMLVVAMEDAVVLSRVMAPAVGPPVGILRRLASVFSKVPLADVEEKA
jgi:AbrB family looped-hinge helix DNA binding protein